MKQNIWFTFFLALALAMLNFSCDHVEEKHETPGNADTTVQSVQQPQKVLDQAVLVGNWIRTDADYRVEIAEIYGDGKLKAGYFNPKSINVADGRWTNDGGILKIYIELRDVNYPGSKYDLSYVEYGDKLLGEYYQAVEGTNYKVEFSRAK